MGNGASQAGWPQNYRQLKDVHDQAYGIIDEAVRLEEQERPNDAVEKYKQGILTIDKALDVVITCPENPDSSWEQACLMVQKMKKSRAEVLMRINSITTAPDFIQHDPPPSYEDAMSSHSSSSSVPRTYNELAAALDSLHVDTPQGLAEIIFTHDGVKLYFIAPDGVVLSTSEAETLNIAIIEGDEGVTPTAFLQVGSWIYPLVPGVSPCYRTDYGAFILPDVHSDIAGSSVGIILPDDADGTVLELLENILHGVIQEQNKSPEILSRSKRYVQPAGMSGSISRGLVNGAYYISRGLVYGAQKTSDLLNYSTPKIINSMQPAPESTNVPRNVTKGLKIAESATNKAAVATGFIAEKVGVATSKLGQFLAPHIQRQGTRLLTSGFHMNEEEASEKVSGVLTVAAGAVEGFATVYKGLETSASILGDNLKTNSVRIVEHKYGYSAGQLAGGTLNTVGNVWSIRNSARIFTPKGLAKKTARQTGKALVEDYRASTSSEPQPLANRIDLEDAATQNHLYPNINYEELQITPVEKSMDRKD